MKFEEVLPALRAGKKIRRKCMSDKYYHIDNNHIYDNIGQLYTFGVEADVLQDDWEIVEELRKVKLRDLTEEQYREYVKGCEEGCAERICDKCPFREVTCDLNNDNCWFYHKDLYSNKFLDREFEIEME